MLKVSKGDLMLLLLSSTHERNEDMFKKVSNMTEHFPDYSLYKALERNIERLEKQLNFNDSLETHKCVTTYMVSVRIDGIVQSYEFEDKESAFEKYLYFYKEMNTGSKWISNTRIYEVVDGIEEELI